MSPQGNHHVSQRYNTLQNDDIVDNARLDKRTLINLKPSQESFTARKLNIGPNMKVKSLLEMSDVNISPPELPTITAKRLY